MGIEQEAAVRSFLAEFEAEKSDSALIERVLGRMAADAVIRFSPGRIH